MLGRVDAGDVGEHGDDGDAEAVFEDAELLEALDLLERRWGKCDVGAQEADAVGVEADVAQDAVTVGEGGISRVGDARAAEVHGHAIAAGDDFDDRGVGGIICGGEGAGDGGDLGAAGFDGAGGRVDDGGLDLGLVALDVDDDVGVGEAKGVAGFGEAAAAVGVVFAGHEDIGPELLTGGEDAGVVGRDDDAREGGGLAGLFPHVLDEGHAGGVCEDFFGEARGAQTGGNHADDRHARA